MAPGKKRPRPAGGSSTRVTKSSSPTTPRQSHPAGLLAEQPDVVSRSATLSFQQSTQPHSHLPEQGSLLPSQSRLGLSTPAPRRNLRPEFQHSNSASAISSQPRADLVAPLPDDTSERHEFFRGGIGRSERNRILNGARIGVSRSTPSGVVPKSRMLACCIAKFSSRLCQIDRSPFQGARTVKELMDHLSFHVDLRHISGVVSERLRREMPVGSRRNKTEEQKFWCRAFGLIFPLYRLLGYASTLCPDQGKPMLGDPHQEQRLKAEQTERFRFAALEFLALSPMFCTSYSWEDIECADIGKLLEIQTWIEYSRPLDPQYPAPITTTDEARSEAQTMANSGWTPSTDSWMTMSPSTTDFTPHMENTSPTAFVDAQESASYFSATTSINHPTIPPSDSSVAHTTPTRLERSASSNPSVSGHAATDRRVYCWSCHDGPFLAWQPSCPSCGLSLRSRRSSPASDQLERHRSASLALFPDAAPHLLSSTGVREQQQEKAASESGDVPMRMVASPSPALPLLRDRGREAGPDGDFVVRRRA